MTQVKFKQHIQLGAYSGNQNIHSYNLEFTYVLEITEIINGLPKMILIIYIHN